MKNKSILIAILFLAGTINISCLKNEPTNEVPKDSTEGVNDSTNQVKPYVVKDSIQCEPVDQSAELKAVILPSYPGGEAALQQFLASTVIYPVIAQENGIEGTVIVQFVIDVDGSITHVEVLESSGEVSLDKEALRVIKAMPKWNPGTVDGEPAKFQYQIPIAFKLEK